MEGFKIGTRVVCVTSDCNWYKEGDKFVIRSAPFIDTQDNAVCYHVKEQPNDSVWIQGSQFKLAEEETKQMFNIKTDPWFIRVNSEQEFEIIQDWLQENYGCCLPLFYSVEFEYLTNTLWTGQVEDAFVMYGQGDPLGTVSRKEIKLTFKTIVNSVEYPEVNSPQQIQIAALQETIEKAAMQIKLLKEGN